jgi:hypothetical protein
MRPVPQPPATVIPSALVDPADSAFVQALSQLRLPQLSRLLASARLQRGPDGPAPRWSATHEWAQAQAWGWSARDGLLPWAAWHARARGLDPGGEQAWAVLTLCHWHVVQGQVSLEPPAALAVTQAESDALRQAMQVYCTQDGIQLHPLAAGQWLAASDLFRQLPSASVERALGLPVADWWVGAGQNPPTAAAQHLRRLQNEMQMLFYTHPCNATRPKPINSFWISGTGDWATASPSASPDGPTPAWLHPAVQALHQAAQLRHVAAWIDAWHAVDAQVLAALDTATAPLVVLCGAQGSRMVQCQPSDWRTRWRAWRAPALTQALLQP